LYYYSSVCSYKKFRYNKNPIEIENVKGFAMFLNIDQFKDIGFFDDNFFIYFEEIDLCRRLRKMKKKNLFRKI